MGEEIDNHPTVIRMNNFVTDGFEDRVGKKLSAWCTNCWWDVPARELDVPIFTPYHMLDDNARCVRWAHIEGVAKLLLPERRWSEAIRMLKERKPSTGLLLLFALSELGLTAVAYGFAELRGGHYWDPQHQHDHPQEHKELYAQLPGIFVRR